MAIRVYSLGARREPDVFEAGWSTRDPCRHGKERGVMGKPQPPGLGRSGHTPVTEGQHAKEVIQGQDQPEEVGATGPVPEANRPGHHPETE